MPSGTIEFVSVHKRFDAPVLTGVTLGVERGETVSIVGPSGAGKSVLLKLANGLIAPDRGDVLIDGQSIAATTRRALEIVRAKTAYVFQNAALFDSLTVLENVAMGISEARARELGRRDVAIRVERALEQVNLDARAIFAKLPGALSGGMRKRVGIARAIIGEPEILLYDEPVTGLDPVNSAVIERLIREIGARADVTSVLVTHDVLGALRISDRVALLHGGRIRFAGTPADFRASDDPLVRAFADADAAAGADLRLLEEK